MYSPIAQNQRHKRILEEFFRKNKIAKNIPIYTIVVIANPKSIIDYKYVKKEIRDEIFKYDQLTNQIKKLMDDNEDIKLSFPAMEKIGNTLIENHVEEQNAFLRKYIEFKSERKDIVVVDDEDLEIEVEPKVESKAELKIETKVEPKVETKPKLELETKVEQAANVQVSVETKIDSNIEDLRTKLKAYRLEQSREENVKAYFIFNNKQMEELLEKKPSSNDELMKCNGFGAVKVEKYGEKILDILKG